MMGGVAVELTRRVRDIWGGEGEILDENIRQILICLIIQIVFVKYKQSTKTNKTSEGHFGEGEGDTGVDGA